MTFRRFEEIRAWQTARKLRKAVYAASAGRKFGRDFGLKDQIRRAAVSITANIAEGFAKQSDKEFAKFLDSAKGSAAEVQDHLYAASMKAMSRKGNLRRFTGTPRSARSNWQA